MANSSSADGAGAGASAMVAAAQRCCSELCCAAAAVKLLLRGERRYKLWRCGSVDLAYTECETATSAIAECFSARLARLALA